MQAVTSPVNGDAKIQKKKKLLNGVNITFTFPSGSKYVGSFRDGKMHGYGEYTYVPSGDVYRGEWKADMKQGQGTYLYSNGDRYIGEWYAGKKNGKGRFNFVSGDEYTGAWKQDKMDGYGVFHLQVSDNRYCGFWREGLRCGRGILYSGNGDIYDGDWKDGKENGFGIFSQVNDEVYCGEWKDGIMDGKGILREKGNIFLVEYMGGYIISKIPFDGTVPDEEVDEGWEKALLRFRKWESGFPDPLRKALNSAADLDELEKENEVLRRRLEDAIRVMRLAMKVEPDENTEKKDLLSQLTKSKAYQMELERAVDELRLKLSLIEGSLNEKMLEHMRLRQDVQEKEMHLNDALSKLEHFEKKAQEEGTSTVTAQEEEQLRQQNLDLLRSNTEYQKKISILTSENARLTATIKSQEEDMEKITLAYEETQMQFKKFSDILSSEQAPQAISDGESEETLAQKLAKINQLNAELTLRNDALEKKLNGELGNVQDAENENAKKSSYLNEKIATLQDQVQNLKAQLEEANSNLYAAQMTIQDLKKENQLLSDNVSTSAKKGCTDASLVKSINDKIDRIAKLENENAELSRLLEETRALLEEDQIFKKEEKHRRASTVAEVDKAQGELEETKKDLAKVQKKLKKVNTEKKKLTADLYESRLCLSRVDRVFQMLNGGIAVMALVSREKASSENEARIKINSLDSSQLIVEKKTPAESASEENDFFQFDHCLDSSATPETWFSELRHILHLVPLGLQAGFITVGGAQTGKSYLMSKLLPLFIEYLSTLDDVVDTQNLTSYRLAVVEVGLHGGYDCVGKSSFRHVLRNDLGLVLPENIQFTDCRIANVMELITKYKDNRIQVDGQSHLWIQIQRIKTHRVLQTSTVGRLTFFDMCGPAPIVNQADLEAAQFANRSFLNLKAVVDSLQRQDDAVPYDKTLETCLLYDLLGGNCFTTVIGGVASDEKRIDTSLETLQVLQRFAKIKNGSYYQDYTSSDILRWREIVSALSSNEQAKKEQLPVDSLRFC